MGGMTASQQGCPEGHTAMNYRRLGRTNLSVSVVGFGTCQLRLVPERQAIATLLRGFELGVNLVHTAPDYAGADDLVARAVREFGRGVIVCSQGYGPAAQFERHFEDTCGKLGKERLELFGIACVDDREALGENVWGRGGMVEFLLRKKAEGRLGGTFCTTHGGPDYLKKLLHADVFDALMVAYNPLGFHLLSYHPADGRVWEDLPATREQIFPLARQHDVGLMIMKPLAGGLLCRGKAFPPRAPIAPQQDRAGEVLRSILSLEGVSCVVPGTASAAEAEENALAGHGDLSLSGPRQATLTAQVRALDTALCSRCGQCESTCSHELPVSWLFRDAYIQLFPSETFEAVESHSYFRLHRAADATCAACTEQTCSCPAGLDIPFRLTQVHDLMTDLKKRGLVSPSAEATALDETPVVQPSSPPSVVARARKVVRRVARAGKALSRRLLQRASPAAPQTGPRYDVAYRSHNMPRQVPTGTRCTLWLEIENQGTMVWQRAPHRGQPVDVALYLDGALVSFVKLPVDEVSPGQRVTLSAVFLSPAAAGSHELKVDLVEQNVAFFAQQGVAGLLVPFETVQRPPTVTSRLMERALKSNYFFSAPTQLVSWRRDGGTYPLFARSANGCRVTDVEGREYVDYVMGWGCALLGHAHPRVQAAVRQALEGGAIISLPHHLEMEVTNAVCAAIPCAEMVVFGKNGSDVCTAAARLARVCTGRHKLLVCGYHGWQDWYVERWGFAAAGVPERPAPLVVPFAFNDPDGFVRLMKQHRGEVAGVMLEPAGPVEGINGPIRDADASFLRLVAEVTRQEGALLIFDEIITGFRYRTGSVQKATGVIPDLACLGKALSAGMPLSALVGRRQWFQQGVERIYFGPTFKGEVYSFAAAREALAICAEQDVPAHVWGYGERLRQGVNERCAAARVAAELVGPPFRMVLRFEEPDPARLVLARTLLQQELLRAGVMTYRGIMLPSLAHDDQALEQTFLAFEKGLAVLARARREDRFVHYLETPPLT